MVGPDKQFDQGEALKNAMEIFWAKGFEATSMQALVEAMGVNRASMYQTFGNKEALFNAAMQQYIESSLQYIKGLLKASNSPLNNIKNLLHELVNQSITNKFSGCFVSNTAAELAPHRADIAKQVRDFWLELEKMFEQALQQAKQKQEIKQDIEIKKMASFINSTLQGLMIKTKAEYDRTSLDNDIDCLISMLKK